MKNYILLIVVFLSKYSFSQETLEIKYSAFVKAYDDYDTVFFNNLKSHYIKLVNKKGERITGFLNGDYITPLIRFDYTKKWETKEYDYTIYKDSAIINIYSLADSEKYITYHVVFKGDKPQLFFYKSRSKWYKPSKVVDCEIRTIYYLKTK